MKGNVPNDRRSCCLLYKCTIDNILFVLTTKKPQKQRASCAKHVNNALKYSRKNLDIFFGKAVNRRYFCRHIEVTTREQVLQRPPACFLPLILISLEYAHARFHKLQYVVAVNTSEGSKSSTHYLSDTWRYKQIRRFEQRPFVGN